MQRFRVIAIAATAVLILACSGSGAVPTAPGATSGPDGAPTGVPTQPGGATTNPQIPAGDLEARARALIPPGSTEAGESTFGSLYQVTVTNPQTLEQLGPFWTTAIPGAGMTETGRFTAGPVLTIAFVNPDGGVVATRDDSTGVTTILISTGINQ
jgi:hypothetical protein